MRGVNPVRDSDLSHRVDRPDALSHATRAKVSMSSATRPSGPVFRVRITQDAERQFSWWERTRHAMRDTFNRTRMKPHILIASLLTGLIMSGILIALAVLMAINEQTTIADDIEAATVQLSAVAESIVQQSIAPAQALSIIIYEDPDWESIHERFETLAVQILSQLTVSNAELFATLEIAPDTIIKEVYPYDGEAETAIGLRLYDHPIEAARETVRQTISSRAFTFQGPLPVNGTEGREIILVSSVPLRCPPPHFRLGKCSSRAPHGPRPALA